MGDISLIEWIVYGIVCYGSIVMTLITLVKDIPQTRNLSLSRVFFTIPGMIMAGVLAGSGTHINFLNTTATHITKTFNGTTNLLITNSTTTDLISNQITLVSPVWTMVHVMFFMILFWFIVSQIMFILKDPNNP